MSEGRLPPIVGRWLRFSAVGIVGVSVQLTMLSLLAGRLEVHYLVATAVAVECAILHNFVWHERWTFRGRGLEPGEGRVARLLRFNAASGLLSIAGNVGFMSLYVGQLGFRYLLGNVMSIASCAVVNFIVNDRLVFLARGRAGPEAELCGR